MTEDIAAVLATHELVWDRRVYPEFECSCGEWDGAQDDNGGEDDGQNDNVEAFRAHVADALAPLIAVRVEAAKAEAVLPIRRYAEAHAVVARARGRDSRDWLDLLILVDRAAALDPGLRP